MGSSHSSTDKGKYIEAPWVKIPMDLLKDADFTKVDLRVYGALSSLCGKNLGYWFGSQARLAEAANVDRRSVIRAIPKLWAKRYISVKHERKNIYCYAVAARWKPKTELDKGFVQPYGDDAIRWEDCQPPWNGQLECDFDEHHDPPSHPDLIHEVCQGRHMLRYLTQRVDKERI